jgi:hypothetical protein
MISKALLAVSVMGIFFAPGKAMAVPFDPIPYFPLTPSQSWTNQVNDTGTSTVTVNPTPPPLINGLQTTELDTVSTITSLNGSKAFNTSDNLGIRLHRRFAPSAVDCFGLRDLQLTFSPPVILANGPTTDIGSIANTAGAAEAVIAFCGTFPLSYTASFTVNGFETVTVPAGIFYNVLKISGTITVTGSVLGQPQNQSLSFTFYQAQNIGQVKFTDGATATSVLTGSTFLPAAATALAAAVLPSSRSAQVGIPVTAFATIINGGGVTATQCGLAPLLNSVNPLPITFSYNLNPPNGSPNTPVDIGPGSPQNYVFSVTASAPFPPTDLKIIFDCTNTNPAPIFVGLTTLLISASDSAVADIVALAATILNDGIVHIPTATGTGVFAVATVNVGGAAADIIASADTGGVSLPVTISICETDPATSLCINPTTPAASATTNISPGETNTFGVFVTGTDNITFDPAGKRIFVRFKQGAVTRGSTSVAVCTDTDPSCP